MKKNVESNMEQYAIYLRKSRKDEEMEALGAGETLVRHEKIMLELAQKMNIIIGKIYREIVSRRQYICQTSYARIVTGCRKRDVDRCISC